MKQKWFAVLLVFFMSGFLYAPDGLAKSRGRDRHRAERDSREHDGSSVSKDRAVAVARKAVGGRVLRVRMKKGAWQVKVLSADGEVYVVYVDAQTGKLISK